MTEWEKMDSAPRNGRFIRILVDARGVAGQDKFLELTVRGFEDGPSGWADRSDTLIGWCESRIIGWRPDTPAREDFNLGYILACSNLVNLHDQPTMAWDVLAELGVTRTEVRRMGLTEYDMAALRKIEREGSQSPYADGRKQKRKSHAS